VRACAQKLQQLAPNHPASRCQHARFTLDHTTPPPTRTCGPADVHVLLSRQDFHLAARTYASSLAHLSVASDMWQGMWQGGCEPQGQAS
jgi:hypothetical protein